MSGEVNMTERSDWYKAMAVATRQREQALKMMGKWREKLIDAEEAIKILSKNMSTETEQE
jgi:hypothetical protein